MTSPSPTRISAQLFDGLSLEPVRAFLELDPQTATLVTSEGSREFPLSDLLVSPRVFDAPRFVDLPNYWQLVCADGPALDVLPQASASEGPVVWLERRTWVAFVAVVTSVAGIACLYLFGLPRLAETIAARVSLERERDFGENTLAALDKYTLGPSELDAETQRDIRAGFDAMRSQFAPGDAARLQFRQGTGLGANAFAFPGGTVVVTDELVHMCGVDESIAVLSHELGHVQHRHVLRYLIQELGVTALGGLVSSDASNLSLSATMVPLMVAEANYSQSFESEADATGFAMLKKAGWSPALFASCLQKLGAKFPKDSRMLSYASSHPPDAERIARANAAALGFVPFRSHTEHSATPTPATSSAPIDSSDDADDADDAD